MWCTPQHTLPNVIFAITLYDIEITQRAFAYVRVNYKLIAARICIVLPRSAVAVVIYSYSRKYFIDHLRSGVVFNFGCVCLSICMYVCLSDDNLRKPWRMKFIFARAVYLRGLRIKFIYKGRRVKINVTGAKKVETFYCRNIKIPSAITPV